MRGPARLRAVRASAVPRPAVVEHGPIGEFFMLGSGVRLFHCPGTEPVRWGLEAGNPFRQPIPVATRPLAMRRATSDARISPARTAVFDSSVDVMPCVCSVPPWR